jgi:hypothetical protein
MNSVMQGMKLQKSKKILVSDLVMSTETRVTQGYELPLQPSSFSGSADEFLTLGAYADSHLTRC